MRQELAEIGRQERRAAMMVDIPLVARAAMRAAENAPLSDVISEHWRRAALMFRVEVWRSGGAYPLEWDPHQEFETADAETLRRWLADEGLTMLAGLRDGVTPPIPPRVSP